MSSEYLVEVKDLKQYFPINTGMFSKTDLKAVDGVSFSIKPGETLGLVGESGCGAKNSWSYPVTSLYGATGGEVYFNGELVTDKNMNALRKEMQMVFQDPYSSLDPRMTVEDIIGEPLDVHKLYKTKAERREKILELMELVGLNAEQQHVMLTNSPADSVSVLVLPVLWLLIRSLLSVMSLSVHLMCLSRHRL